MNYKLLSILSLMVLLGACSTPRNVAYFQGIDELTAKQRELMTQTYNPRICADDLLTINVCHPKTLRSQLLIIHLHTAITRRENSR